MLQSEVINSIADEESGGNEKSTAASNGD